MNQEQIFPSTFPTCYQKVIGWNAPVALILILCVLASGGQAFSQTAETADLILHNGKIVTVDDSFRIADAVAVKDGRVLAVGGNQEILARGDERTRVINLEGRMLLPGIFDTHVHLMDYALYHSAYEVAPEIANFHVLEESTVKDILEELGRRIQRDPGMSEMPWLVYDVQPGQFDSSIDFANQVDRRMLDRIAPDRALLVRMNNANFDLVNSAGLKVLQESFSLKMLNAELDSSGEPTGRLGAGSVHNSVIPSQQAKPMRLSQRRELLARAYKKELEEWASYGVTTWASKLTADQHAAFSLLDQRGEMPIRLAYALDDLTAEAAEIIPAGLEGTGTPYLWMTGIYGGSADSDMAGPMCSTIPLVPKDFGLTQPQCTLQPGSEMWNTLYAALFRGFRIGGFHNHGDLGTDYIFMLIEQASKDAGMTLDQIRQKKHALDHCAANPRRDQMEKGKQLGIVWTCTAKYIMRADLAAKNRDPEKLAQYVVPLQSMIEVGLHPAFHTDGHDGGPLLFLYLQAMITRKDPVSGRIWNLQEAIDRKDVLRSATRWGAAYALRETELGSIEPGKWADMIIIDRDFLAVPVDEISRIRVLATLVGGKLVYKHPESTMAISGIPKFDD